MFRLQETSATTPGPVDKPWGVGKDVTKRRNQVTGIRIKSMPHYTTFATATPVGVKKLYGAEDEPAKEHENEIKFPLQIDT